MPTDLNQRAKAIVDLATGEREAQPARLETTGREGGKKGGPARAQKLSGEERSAIARKAARARWAKAAPPE